MHEISRATLVKKTKKSPTPAGTGRTGSGWQSIGPVTGYRREADSLHVQCGSARLRIRVERSGMIRVRLESHGDFGRDHSWSVIPDESVIPAWELKEDSEYLSIETDLLRVHIQRDPCRVSYHARNGERIAGDEPNKGMAWAAEESRCWQTLCEDDHIFGLGERGGSLDKRGDVVVNWNHDASEHNAWSDPLYQSHPFFIVMNRERSYGIFFHNTWRASFDMGKTSPDCYSFGADGGAFDYYFIPGPTPADVVRRYGALVGTTPLPPRWALGYQQCRWSYESARRVRGIARRLRERRIPCDTIYLDIDYMDGFRCFTWHPKRFARPERLTKELAGLGYQTVAILDPGIKKESGYDVYESGLAGGHFCLDGNGEFYVGKVWPGDSVFPDFTRKDTRAWWGDLYKGLIECGVRGFWNDMNEPADFTSPLKTVPLSVRHDNEGSPTDHRAVHNVYGMQMARGTFEGVRRLRVSERPFVLTRAGFSGVQRYAAVWTGDNQSSWEHLRMSIPMLLNMGLSGITYCGADIGGFHGTPSAELFTRWLQLGIFYPLCRTHTCGGLEDDGDEQDPTAYGPKHERLNRRAIELRYRLLPYLYTQMRESARTGLPLLRPMLLAYPNHPDVHTCAHEFMFGDDLFVAPVVTERVRSRRIRLPEGDWYDFEEGTHRTGGEEWTLPVDLGTIPLFARGGAIIPMREVVQYVDERPLEELILHIYPGTRRGTFYNDDGLSYNYETGDYILESYEVVASKKSVRFILSDRSGEGDYAPRRYRLQFKALPRVPKSVTVSGRPLTRRKTKQALNKAASGWYYDRAKKTVQVCLDKIEPGETVEVV
ncbi:MAG: glycoside hydrolase family 31 protein [Phycisphaerae bacterium]